MHNFSLPLYIQNARKPKYINPDPPLGWWVFGTGGIFGHYNISSGDFQDFTAGFEQLNPEMYVNFLAICEDQPNHFWIGRTDGLFEVTFQESIFQKLDEPPGMEITEAFNPRSMHTLKDSSMLIGSYTGMYRYFPGSGIYIPIKLFDQNSQQYVNPLAYDYFEQGDTIFIGSESYGLLFYNQTSDEISAWKSRDDYVNLGAERSIA